MIRKLRWSLLAVVSFISTTAILSQQLQPRIYTTLPQKLNFLVIGDTYSIGGFAIDAAIPVEDFRMKTNQIYLAYAKSLNVFGKSGQIQVLVPYLNGKAELIFAGQDTVRHLNGFVDPRVRFGINLIGGDSKPMGEFVNYKPEFTLGISLLTVAPFGRFETDRILNIGSNRWSFKPEIGLTKPISPKLTFEFYGGIWLFTENNEYLGTSTVKQDPIVTTQAHIIYSFGKMKPWISVSGTYYTGGETTVDDLIQNNFQNNYRIGGVLSFPINFNHTFKLNMSFGVSTRFGQKLNNYGLLYQYSWFSKPKKESQTR